MMRVTELVQSYCMVNGLVLFGAGIPLGVGECQRRGLRRQSRWWWNLVGVETPKERREMTRVRAPPPRVVGAGGGDERG